MPKIQIKYTFPNCPISSNHLILVFLLVTNFIAHIKMSSFSIDLPRSPSSTPPLTFHSWFHNHPTFLLQDVSHRLWLGPHLVCYIAFAISSFLLLFHSGKSAEYCNKCVCLSVHKEISRTTSPTSPDFLSMLAWSLSGSTVPSYVLPVFVEYEAVLLCTLSTLLRSTGCILSQMTVGTKTRQVHPSRDATAEYIQCTTA